MRRIKELLTEYEIRFKETDEILESSAFNCKDLVNKRDYSIQINENRISNENGVVYKGGKWATAKLTEKPEKWVVEKDENHPMWEKFKEWYYLLDITYPKRVNSNEIYFSNDGLGQFEGQLTYFKGYQYLTLDQWAEFFLPKVDFSIHNDHDWVFLKMDNSSAWLSKGKLMENGCISFCLENETLYTKHRLIDNLNEIIELRKPTDEEMNILYENYPEYAPPKEGGWGIFWNEWPGPTKVDFFVNMTSEGRYLDFSDYSWKNFKLFSPKVQEAINNEIDEIN